MIFLSGGGDETKTKAIDSFFLRKIPGGNILFVPVAKNVDMNGYKKSLKWVTAKLENLSDRPLNITMLIDLAACGDLSDYSAIYLGGGNTYKLLHLANQSGFSEKLKAYLGRDGHVYGASAGAVLMGRDISTYIEEKYLPENERQGYTETRGLGLLGPYSVITHFHEADRAHLDPYFERFENPVIAIPEGTAVMVQGGSMTVVGDRGVDIFDKNRISATIEPYISKPLI